MPLAPSFQDVPLHEAQTINIKMMPEGRVPELIHFSFQQPSVSRNKVFYPDQINPNQEETKTV